jgi:hypothetical protein
LRASAMTDAALPRLVAYCRRAKLEPPEFNPYRNISAELRRIVWRDVEARDALLKGGYDDAQGRLEALGLQALQFALLDVATGLAHEAEARA